MRNKYIKVLYSTSIIPIKRLGRNIMLEEKHKVSTIIIALIVGAIIIWIGLLFRTVISDMFFRIF